MENIHFSKAKIQSISTFVIGNMDIGHAMHEENVRFLRISVQVSIFVWDSLNGSISALESN